MEKITPDRSFVATVVLGAIVFFVALNLRTPFASLPVLLPDIVRDLNLSNLHSGNFTTLPTLCLGLFAPFAPFLTRRLGMEKTLFVVLIIIAAGIALRSVGTLGLLYAGAIMAGSAIAIANVLLPALIKRDFAAHMALMTGLYTMGICGSGALAAAFSVPLQQNWFDGSWRLALGFWALPVVVVALMWLTQANRLKTEVIPPQPHVKGLWRDALAWQITLLMGFQSAMAYIGYGWMAPILHERGFDPAMAGQITSISILAQMVGCLVAPGLIGRRASQSGLNVALSLVATAGFAGIFLAPLGDWIRFFAIVQGFGQGGMLAAAMMMIVLRSRNAHVATYLAGMAQSVGYCIAAAGPFAVGFIRDSGGSLTVSGLIPLVVGLSMAGFGFLAGRPLLCKVQIIETMK